jgi:hypothetical protein
LTAATIICFILWRRWRRGQVILNDRYEVWDAYIDIDLMQSATLSWNQSW